jgi:hypothetical protein
MPAKPAWFHRLDLILSELRALDSDYLDRLAVERIFSVRDRRARQLMAGLPCLQIGNAVAVSRAALIQRLETMSAGDRFQWEIRRRARVIESLETLRKHAASIKVQVPAPAGVRDRLFDNLSAEIEFRPGELRIHFAGAADLAAKLFELSQAMANDWDTFVKAVDSKPSAPLGALIRVDSM